MLRLRTGAGAGGAQVLIVQALELGRGTAGALGAGRPFGGFGWVSPRAT